MKKKLTVLIVAMLVIALALTMAACSVSDAKYYENIAKFEFWENDGDKALPQTAVSGIVEDHLNAPGTKAKKVAILGFDGGRADGLVNIIKSGVLDKNGTDIYSGKNQDATFSAINAIRKDGGAYLSYAGGEKGKSSQQATSTAPGWASILSGVWGEKNGVIDNGEKYPKNMDNKTILLKAAEFMDLRTSFNASWEDHFTRQYKPEIDYLAANQNIPMVYNRAEDDTDMHAAVLDQVTEGSAAERDVVFAIYEAPDYNGHSENFGNTNYRYATSMKSIDNLCYEVLQKIESRSTYADEDWLILLTSDHGGILLSHGGQTLEERATFIVTNKKIDPKYFAKGYDGFKQN